MDELEARRLKKRVEGKVRRFVADNDVLSATGGLLLAVSGGPDSTALVLILKALVRRDGPKLAIAHFDHALRGEEASQREAAFVRSLAETHGLPYFEDSADVRARAKSDHISIEEAARRERYAFLADAAREAGCDVVATGHTASDQAETVLLHVLRGAGLAGLGGIAPRASWPFVEEAAPALARPLLCLTSEETRAYCAASGITPIEDQSNASQDFARNRIRHELLPTLRGYNPQVEAALVRLSDAARDDLAFIETVAASAVEVTQDGATVSRALLASWPQAPRSHALRGAYSAAAGDARELGERHIAALDRLLRSGRTGDALDLPREVRAELQRDVLLFRRGEQEVCALPEIPIVLSVPGEARLGSLLVAASKDEDAQGTYAAIDAEAAGARLTVRRRRDGDRFQPLGMRDSKKLQDFFVDARVPRAQRDAVPLFENERGIVWVGGLRLAEWAKARPGRPAIVLSYRNA